MCRWIAYSGQPIGIDTLVINPSHSLMRQSFDSKMHYKSDGTINVMNADGFGLGWFSDKPEPALYKIADPAWSNENIKEICTNVKSHLFMAHIRDASTGAIQRSNAHPFKHDKWIFQHNGRIDNFITIKRELQFDIEPDLFPLIRGTTDSETIFFLLLTYGLDYDPIGAVRRMIERVERACVNQKIPIVFTLSCAISNGKELYTINYANGAKSNSQYYSSHQDCMNEQSSDTVIIPARSVVVVSEPLAQNNKHWIETPDGTFATILGGEVQIQSL